MNALLKEVERQFEVISAGTAEIISAEELIKKLHASLSTGTPLRVKLGIDPTNPDIHFNCLCGRDLQRDRGLIPQVVITLPLLKGLDLEKMSKSKGNHISVLSSAAEKIGKIMSLPDSLMNEYMELASSWDMQIQAEKKADHANGRIHPMKLKLELAKSIASPFHTKEDVDRAAAEFERVFSRKELPGAIPTLRIDEQGTDIVDVLKKGGLVNSASEARRLIEQGGVEVDGSIVTSFTVRIKPFGEDQIIVRIGKRRYVRIVRR